MKKVDLGCGKSKKKDYIGVDWLDVEGVDISHDLNSFPYPFSDNEIDEIWADNILEHLENPIRVVEEIHRICRQGARVTVTVPYFRSAYAFIDPTHKNFFGVYWFDFFNPESWIFDKYAYSEAKYQINRIEFDQEFKSRKNPIYRLVRIIAQKNPHFYELRLSHLYPLNSLTFYLEVVK